MLPIRNYSNPAVPQVPGIEKFCGMKIHSHDYRDSSVFKGKSTVVIGCGPSGLDISFDIAKVADKVIITIFLIKTHRIYSKLKYIILFDLYF